ncbi:hypothetical protein CEP54_015558 [Fusarium duplospermum]|uniref:Uncharacterized protein n=1 Tax=Fusarium duplospermum TaxID=1325734 RepID=A0A428NN89_9HYPO|nr:hypothetical protein CEP54_015558 [Fusarium duplospermum]
MSLSPWTHVFQSALLDFTCLGYCPVAWAATVAVWRNWRVIQQDEPVSLQALLGRFKKYAFVPDLFAQILKDAPKQPDPVPAPAEPPKFDANEP